MMNREEIADELERLQIDYRHVYDGGHDGDSCHQRMGEQT